MEGDDAIRVHVDMRDDYVVIVNPPHYVLDPAGTYERNGRTYTYDPLGAICHVLRHHSLA